MRIRDGAPLPQYNERQSLDMEISDASIGSKSRKRTSWGNMKAFKVDQSVFFHAFLVSHGADKYSTPLADSA